MGKGKEQGMGDQRVVHGAHVRKHSEITSTVIKRNNGRERGEETDYMFQK